MPASSSPVAAARAPRAAAWLLGASVVLPLVGLNLAMNGFDWGLGYPASSYAWSAIHLALIPGCNVASLLLADRSRRWVKLNYVVVLLGAMLRILEWLVSSSVRM